MGGVVWHLVKERIMASVLGAFCGGEYTMFYICEMTGKLRFDHDGVF